MRASLAVLAALVLTISGSGLVTAAAGPDLPVAFDGSVARVSWDGGASLAPAAGSPLATVSAYLATRGRDARTIGSLRIERSGAFGGRTHVLFRQEVGGLPVAGAYAKAAFDGTGALVHLIDALAAVPATVAPGSVAPEAALGAAIGAVIPSVADRPALVGRSGGVATFARTPAFFQAPTAREVLLARQSGRLERAWQVTTWTADQNLLDVTLVDAAGAVAGTERRTAADSYNVFVEDPDKGSQTIVPSPASATASASGWLSGSQTTIQISGPNAKAYLDRDANNSPDSGGSAVTDGNFVASADFTKQPDGSAANQAVAVQNLFYLNNIAHDVLYGYGFTPSTGNFQGNDPVLAEAQDGSGTDNANFSTPADGSSPRMQMYLWHSPLATHDLLIGSGGARDAYGAGFGPALDTTGKSGVLALVNDNAGASSTDLCEAMPKGSLKSKIAVIDRGTCTFVTKVTNAQSAGAIGAIIVNNVADPAFTMGGSGRVSIPSIMVAQSERSALVSASTAGTSGRIRLKSVQPIMLDGDVDADVVYHEYGHGLTWRLIGSMSGSMAGAIGEGASDVLAMFMNGDDAIGEYSMQNKIGIRTATYGNMTKTYSSMTGAEVHDDGEVYGRIGWLLYRAYTGGGGKGREALLTTWVAGLDLTPAGPNMTQMRDGMLAAAPADERCTIRIAFATAGVGEGATATVRRGSITATDSFVSGGGCPNP